MQSVSHLRAPLKCVFGTRYLTKLASIIQEKEKKKLYLHTFLRACSTVTRRMSSNTTIKPNLNKAVS